MAIWPGLQSVSEAFTGSLHAIYLLSGLLARTLVLTVVISLPSNLQLIEER